MHFFKKKNSFKHTSYIHFKKNCAFINAFSQKKNHSNIHHICISKKNYAFINVFSKKKIIQTYIIYALKKIHAFINAFSQKKNQIYIIYTFPKISCIHKCILKKKCPKFHECVLSKNNN